MMSQCSHHKIAQEWHALNKIFKNGMLLMLFTHILEMFHIDMISIIMISLVSFIGLSVCLFSSRYMQGDSLYKKFFIKIVTVFLSVCFISVVDNLVLFLISWGGCNLIVVQLIVHKSTWKAAQASGNIANKNFIIGFSFILLSFCIFYHLTGSLSIQYIVYNTSKSCSAVIALLLLFVGAMTQSAIWPFHRWLISALNAPTPVSALMHAGILNGGGFLLARFAPLYFNAPIILNSVFILGMTSALLGTLWSLMQHDIKRTLACSTMGQMGFMFVQFGLGFFASGLAHLCWHGMFKAYLFLASGSAAQEKRIKVNHPVGFMCLVFSMTCGALASYIFFIINCAKVTYVFHMFWN
jgi:NAD(P)H-quinone oxidoreductase subunit 5